MSQATSDIVGSTGADFTLTIVGTVTTGSVRTAIPKHTIDLGDTPGFVELFGS